MRGSLRNGEVLPKKGSGYELMAQTIERRARFGVIELVMLIKEASHRVHSRHKGVKLQVGDLSSRKGGRIDHHGSHQNGRDVDLAFYMVNGAGNPAKPKEFVPFDANGFSVKPAMKYRFDTRRNWALVSNLVRSKRAHVQWIFVADSIRAKLLAYAKENGVSPSTIQRAKQVMKQPGKSSHWDHFHVRIYCPSSDVPGCEDVGPKWAWTR